MKVRAESELIEINKRMLIFKVAAYCGDKLIGEGIHKRSIVTNESFLAKINAGI